ncbi:MAG: SPOR domain-containing protein [Paracoccaceae bacterium]
MGTDDAEPRLSLWMRFRKFLKSLGAFLAELTGAIAVLVFLTVIGFLGFDQVRYWVQGPDTAALERRDFLCTQHGMDRPKPGSDPLAEIAADISRLKEKARAFAQPSDPIGRISTFISCATVDGVSSSGVDLRLTVAGSQLIGLPSAELIALEREEIAHIKYLFPQIPSRIIEKIESKLQSALHIQVAAQASPVLIERIDTPDAVAEPGLPDPVVSGVAIPPPSPEPSISVQPPVVVRADEASWVLVVGADKSEDAAVDQVAQMRRILTRSAMSGEHVTLFVIRDWNRTVIPFETREEADRALLELTSQLPYGGYLRNIDAWCELDAPGPIAPWKDTSNRGRADVPRFACSD